MSRQPSIVITCRVPAIWKDALLRECEARGIDPSPPRGKPGGFSELLRQMLEERIGATEEQTEEKGRRGEVKIDIDWLESQRRRSSDR